MSSSYHRPRVPWRRTGKQPKTETTRSQRWHCQPADKWAYVSRKDARRAAKVVHPDEPQLAAYHCQHADHWHIGHVDVHARNYYRRESS